MPVRTYQSKADYDRDYETRYPQDRPDIPERITLNYDRQFGLAIAGHLVDDYLAALPIQPTDSILIFGCGFGWSAEVFEQRGYPFVVGTDISPFVHAEKDTDEESLIDAKIIAAGLDPNSGHGAIIKSRVWTPGPKSRASRGVLNEDGKTGGSRGRIKQALGLSGNETITWAITELVVETLTDQEVIDGTSDLSVIADNIVHVVAPEGRDVEDENWNLKTLAGWKALTPDTTILEAGTRRVL